MTCPFVHQYWSLRHVAMNLLEIEYFRHRLVQAERQHKRQLGRRHVLVVFNGANGLARHACQAGQLFL